MNKCLSRVLRKNKKTSWLFTKDYSMFFIHRSLSSKINFAQWAPTLCFSFSKIILLFFNYLSIVLSRSHRGGGGGSWCQKSFLAVSDQFCKKFFLGQKWYSKSIFAILMQIWKCFNLCSFNVDFHPEIVVADFFCWKLL